MSVLGNREPVVIAAAIRSVILAAVTFGVDLSPEQIASVMLAVEAVLALITRQSVTSSATLLNAGTSKAQVVAQAESNIASAAADAEASEVAAKKEKP